MSSRDSVPFQMTPAQHRAFATLRAEHAKTLAREEAWTVVPAGIRAATVWALARMGAVRVKTETVTDSKLIKGPFGRFFGGTKAYTYVVLYVQPTPDDYYARVRAQIARDDVRARIAGHRG